MTKSDNTGLDPCVLFRYSSQGRHPARDSLISEAPLEIRINDDPLLVTMRTPGADRQLAAGLLLAEGIAAAPHDLGEISHVDDPHSRGNILNVEMARPNLPGDGRSLPGSSACGLCGKPALESLRIRHLRAVDGDSLRVDRTTILTACQLFRECQPMFQDSGGNHAAALVDSSGRIRALEEDVGRHNAVDKVLGGFALAGDWPIANLMLLVSGRVGFEIAQKAISASIPIVVAIGAPSTAAVELAVAFQQTVVGFVRDGRFNVYSHAGRITHRGS